MTKAKRKECLCCGDGECRPCWLYVVVGSDGEPPVKVGISCKPTRRLAQHRKKEARPLIVAFKIECQCEFVAMNLEQEAINTLGGYRTRGDWFDCSTGQAISAVLGAVQ